MELACQFYYAKVSLDSFLTKPLVQISGSITTSVFLPMNANGSRLWALAASLLAQPRSSFENESINLNYKFHLNTKSPLPEAAVVSWGNLNHSSFTLIV